MWQTFGIQTKNAPNGDGATEFSDEPFGSAFAERSSAKFFAEVSAASRRESKTLFYHKTFMNKI